LKGILFISIYIAFFHLLGINTMKVKGKHFSSIWVDELDKSLINIIDQRKLPFEFKILQLRTIKDYFDAIKDMAVRGAPLIGVTAGFAIYVAALESQNSADWTRYIVDMANYIKSARPTAVNLEWAVNDQLNLIESSGNPSEYIELLYHNACKLRENDIEINRQIGINGVVLIENLNKYLKRTVNILTHCNAGWLATVDYGTALSPIFEANARGIDVHVWVDETRPRNQGAKLTAWELENEGIKHTVIPDNTGGHLMQNGIVDIVIVGTDRTSINGDVANKIGTYLKALAAYDNNIPFYVAAPSSSIDFSIDTSKSKIPIEQRDQREVRYVDGLLEGQLVEILTVPEESPCANYAFDVTPSRLVTGLITEMGICSSKKEGISNLFPNRV